MGIRPRRSAITTVILTWLVWIGPVRAQVPPPTDVRNLVVFVAKEKPDLYRLVGRQSVPYGTAKFYNPKAIVADPEMYVNIHVFTKTERLEGTFVQTLSLKTN